MTPTPSRTLAAFMAVFALLALTVISCTDFGSGLPPDPDRCVPSESPTVSFSNHILPIFQAKCSGNFCHIPCKSNNGGGLCLASYDSLSASGDVIPCDAENSLMVRYLDGRKNPRMPYERTPLNDSMMYLIRTWIDEGAQEN